jgi:hypothetical protein
MIDALGKEIVVGAWYGYSRNDGGQSHTTIGRVGKVTPGNPSRYKPAKVRLVDCKVNRFIYGEPTDYRKDEVAKDVSIAAYMVFPVPAPEM